MGARRYEIFLPAFKLDISLIRAELERKKLNSYLHAFMILFINISLIVEIADWLKLDINTCEKLSYQNTCAETIFLSGENPYSTL
jgi:hypothetical protein